jgi:hypothetical protein
MKPTRTLNPHALSDFGASTRESLANAMMRLITLDAKYLRGENLTDAESSEYVTAQRLVNAFSGEVVAHVVRQLFVTARGQRVVAAALPPAIAVNVQQQGQTEQLFERDGDGEIARVVTRPLSAAAT